MDRVGPASIAPETGQLRRGLTLGALVALVVGNQLGTSLYTLPASVANAAGPLGVVSWLVGAVGFWMLAEVVAGLGPRFERTGGPYVFADAAFGRFVGFQTAWCYWLSVWGQFDSTLIRFLAPVVGRTRAPKITRATANLRNIDPITQRFLVANVFAPMWSGVLKQLHDWLSHDAFRSEDKALDYRHGIAALQIPTLVIGGTVDFLAPPDLTREYFDLLTTPVRQLELFGRSYGHSAEYGHGDLMVGKQVQVEVYPVIRRFLEANVAAKTG